jgi:hypothetical protein
LFNTQSAAFTEVRRVVDGWWSLLVQVFDAGDSFLLSESWHNATALGNSKADLQAFATELSKQMGMRYEAPPMPVHLTLRSSAGAASSAPLSLPQLDHDDAPAVDSAREAHGLKAAQAAAALFGTDLSPFSSRSEEP